MAFKDGKPISQFSESSLLARLVFFMGRLFGGAGTLKKGGEILKI
jgi:hypothetical protein